MNLAPIVLFVYNRPDHTQSTIDSLKSNYLAQDSELFIFSDGAKKHEDVYKVNEVRKVISGISGFKKVFVNNSETNKGLANSVIQGVTDVIEKYGKVIVLEDDILCSKYFLTFMNNALNLYRSNNKLWSVSAYSPNLVIPSYYKYDTYLSVRGYSWGWATWIDRWDTIDWNIEDYETFKRDISMKRVFNLGGNELSYMLDEQMHGRIDSWAVRWYYNQFKKGGLTIFPCKSLVSNIGLDMSGTHGSLSKRHINKFSEYLPNINKDIMIDQNIVKEFKKFYDLRIIGYISLFFRKIGIIKYLKSVYIKIFKLFKL